MYYPVVCRLPSKQEKANGHMQVRSLSTGPSLVTSVVSTMTVRTQQDTLIKFRFNRLKLSKFGVTDCKGLSRRITVVKIVDSWMTYNTAVSTFTTKVFHCNSFKFPLSRKCIGMITQFTIRLDFTVPIRSSIKLTERLILTAFRAISFFHTDSILQTIHYNLNYGTIL